MFSLRDVMTPAPPFVSVELTVTEAVALIEKHGTPIPVCSSDRVLRGLITTRDFAARVVARGGDPDATRIGDILSPTLAPSVELDDSTDTVLFAMRVHSLSQLPVLDEGRLVGMVSASDLRLIPAQMGSRQLVA